MYRYEELDVWKLAANLSVELYRDLATLRDFGFKDQITRSGLSIPSNIAEGYERDSSRDGAKFLKYAKGSAGELRTQIFIGMKAGFITKEKGEKWIKEVIRISAMLSSLIKRFNNS